MTEQEEFEFRLRFEKESAVVPSRDKGADRREMVSRETAAFLSPLRGIKDVIDTGAEYLARGFDAMTGTKEGERVKAMNDAGKREYADLTSGSAVAPVGRVVGNIVGTGPVGGVVAAPVKALGATRLGNAIASSGFSTGGAATNRLADLGIRSAGGAVTGGASAALINPDDAGLGAAVGGLAPGAAQLLGKAGGAVGRAIRPNINNPQLAAKAIQEYGIPLGPADISQSRMTRAARSVLNDAPLIGGIGERQAQGVQRGFNRAVGRTFGAEAESLTPDVLDAAKKRMGGEFDRLWNRNALQFDGDLFAGLQDLRANAAKLPQGDSARLSSWLDDIESKMVAGPNGELSMSGEVANRLQSKLRQQADSATGFLKEDLQTLRRGILEAFKRGLSPDDASALTANMGQYRAMKTVEPLLNSAEAGVAGRAAGDVPAGLLPNVVRKQYGSGIGSSPFADLSQIGSQYVADRVARTGGGPRALIQNSALGAALGVGGTANPLLALAAVPGAIGAQKALGSPALARLLLRQRGPNALEALLTDPAIQEAVLRASPAIAANR